MLKLTIRSFALQALKKQFHGILIGMDDEGYDAARTVWNGLVDKYPALIARCQDVADVALAISFAREQHLPLSVRGGGHNVAGTALNNGGIVVDLSQMKRISVDPTRREFVGATQQYGLGTTVGVNSTTGLSGLTLGGGIGWLMGTCGLTVDNLLAVTLVTADGQVLNANSQEHVDLFWGVRGGGGNFGVVTSFEYRLHPVGTLLAGKVAYPMSRAKDVLRFYRDYSSSAPDELTVYASFITKPDGTSTGTPAVGLSLAYNGPVEQGERIIAPLRHLGEPLADTIGPKSYSELTAMMDKGSPRGRRYYEKHEALPVLSDGAIDALVAYGQSRTSRHSQILIQHVHGAPTRVAPDTTPASALRRAQYLIGGVAAWNAGESGHHLDWSRAFGSELRPFAQDAVYVNFLDRDEIARVPAVYGPNYARLVALKRRYDPSNLFRLNQNIAP